MLEELGMVNDVCGYLVMLPREWYLRVGLTILSRVLGLILIKPNEERCFGFGFSERSSIFELDIV